MLVYILTPVYTIFFMFNPQSSNSKFFHAENQDILWGLVQKSPYFLSVVSCLRESGPTDTWFRLAIRQFHAQLHATDPDAFRTTTVRELFALNRTALDFIVQQLKTVESSRIHDTLLQAYNVGDEKQRKQSEQNSQYEQFQMDYHKLLAKPAPSTAGGGVGRMELNDEKIHNMDELIQEQIRQREAEDNMFANRKISAHQPVHQPAHQPVHQPAHQPESGKPPRIRILGEHTDHLINVQPQKEVSFA